LQGLFLDPGNAFQNGGCDAARGTVLLYQATNPKHKIYNIATGIPRSVGEAAALSKKHSRFPVAVEIGPGTLMPRCKALDITRAREEFGYEPKYSLEDGVKNYAEWISRQISGQRLPSSAHIMAGRNRNP